MADVVALGRPKLRVLCLHGRCQTSATFEAKIERSLGKCSSFADFVKGWWAEGEPRSTESSQVREASPGVANILGPRGWSETSINGGFPRNQMRLPESNLIVLDAAAAKSGPFDGVLGFSEGAVAAQLAVHLAQALRQGGHGLVQ
eukprot:Skav204250  [mRNA]  locus=scaffold912:64462:67062:- [translate_table: standard]